MTSRLAAPAALVTILLLDVVNSSRQWPLFVEGLLDEPAHLLTAWLVATAVLPVSRRHLLPWVLVGAVVIDVDHVPLYLWDVGTATPDGRPVTHSVLTATLLGVLAVSGGRLRGPLLGLALGVLLHLARDLATGPGVPLAWPLYRGSVLASYVGYLAVAAAAALLVTLRLGIERSATAEPESRE